MLTLLASSDSDIQFSSVATIVFLIVAGLLVLWGWNNNHKDD